MGDASARKTKELEMSKTCDISNKKTTKKLKTGNEQNVWWFR